MSFGFRTLKFREVRLWHGGVRTCRVGLWGNSCHGPFLASPSCCFLSSCLPFIPPFLCFASLCWGLELGPRGSPSSSRVSGTLSTMLRDGLNCTKGFSRFFALVLPWVVYLLTRFRHTSSLCSQLWCPSLCQVGKQTVYRTWVHLARWFPCFCS